MSPHVLELVGVFGHIPFQRDLHFCVYQLNVNSFCSKSAYLFRDTNLDKVGVAGEMGVVTAVPAEDLMSNSLCIDS